MKHLFITALLFLFGSSLMAQPRVSRPIDSDTKTWCGLDISHLKPEFLVSDDHVHFVDLDEKSGMLYAVVQKFKNEVFEGPIRLLAYSLSAKEVVWSMKYVDEHSHYLRIDNIPMIHSNMTTWAFNPQTGKELWSVDAEINKVLSGNKPVVVGYSIVNAKKAVISGFDLGTGRVVWQYTYTHPANSQSLALVSDSALMIFDNGIQYINLYTGKFAMHSVYAAPGLGEHSRVPDVFSGKTKKGLLHFVVAENVDGEQSPLFGRKHFNSVLREGIIYHAGSKVVRAMPAAGGHRWSFISPKELTGIVKLFFHGEYLYLVNYGAPPAPGDLPKSGEVFIATIDPAAGSVVKMSQPGMLNWPYVTDFVVKDDHMVLSMPGRMASIALDGLELEVDVPFTHPGMTSGIGKFTAPKLYLTAQGNFENIETNKAGSVYMLQTNWLAIEFSRYLSSNKAIPLDRLFYPSQRIGNRTVVSNGKVRFVVGDDLSILPIRFTSNMRRFGNYLCDWELDRVLILPVKAVEEMR